MSEYSVAPRKLTNKMLETVDFDSIVVITMDTHTNMLSNWWHFSGHPHNYGVAELSSIAQQMTAQTAEFLKTDINNPSGRIVDVKVPKFERTKFKDGADSKWLRLFGVAIGIKKSTKRMWIDLWFARKDFGLFVNWNKTEGEDLYVAVLMLSLLVTVRIDA